MTTQLDLLHQKIHRQAENQVEERARTDFLEILFGEETAYGWYFDIASHSGKTYQVSFFLAEGGLEADYECSCGYFEIHDRPCKHIIAAINFLQKNG